MEFVWQVLVFAVEAGELHRRFHGWAEGGDVPRRREVRGDDDRVLLRLQGLPDLADRVVAFGCRLEPVAGTLRVVFVHALHVEGFGISVGASLLDLRREVGDLAHGCPECRSRAVSTLSPLPTPSPSAVSRLT
jgi:hypothetical protein